jgi:hypothetical protein
MLSLSQPMHIQGKGIQVPNIESLMLMLILLLFIKGLKLIIIPKTF